MVLTGLVFFIKDLPAELSLLDYIEKTWKHLLRAKSKSIWWKCNYSDRFYETVELILQRNYHFLIQCNFTALFYGLS